MFSFSPPALASDRQGLTYTHPCVRFEKLWKGLKSNPWLSPPPMDGMLSAVGTGVAAQHSGSEHSLGVRGPGLATDGLCALERVSLSCVLCSKIGLTSKPVFQVPGGALVPGVVYHSHVGGGGRVGVQRKEQLLGEGGAQGLQRGGDICFAP